MEEGTTIVPTNTFDQGSIWRQWDLHIHTPASFHWEGQKFIKPIASSENNELIDEMIHALNKATPDVFALMDYWTFDGWFALNKRLKEADAPKLNKTVFPGMELRLVAPMSSRLNAHVIFSDNTTDQTLKDFKAALHVEIADRPLSEESLIELARTVGEDKLSKHGHKIEEVRTSKDKALFAGSQIAEINSESYKKALAGVPDGLALGFMPWDTNDGLAHVDWAEHYSYVKGLFKSSPIFESRNDDVRAAFLNITTLKNETWINNFQAALGNKPRLVVSGSDAHRFTGNEANKRGYGNFPGGKATWIKADPTFQGLEQAIREPEKRSFVGKEPEKVTEVEANRTFYLSAISTNKISGGSCPDDWIDGCSVNLNPDLVAIIGNKGSGKSALADIIAFLGNSKQSQHFTFLKKNRFYGKTGEPAKSFEGKLTWLDGSTEIRNLHKPASLEKVELVKYIPQGHFEELCNEHVSGESNAFEDELRKVIFDHTDDDTRMDAFNFAELLTQQEKNFVARLDEQRSGLLKVNREIASTEARLNPSLLEAIKEHLALKEKQIEEHASFLPPTPIEPDSVKTGEQVDASAKLDEISRQEKKLSDAADVRTNAASERAKSSIAANDIKEKLEAIERFFHSFESETENDLDVLGLAMSDIATLSIDLSPIEQIETRLAASAQASDTAAGAAVEALKKLTEEKTLVISKLNAPQLKYQQDQNLLTDWNAKQKELVGNQSSPDTLEGLKESIRQYNELPESLAVLRNSRIEITREIYQAIDSQRNAREKLYGPVQKLISSNELIREGYKLQFQAIIGSSVDAMTQSLFTMVKQNTGKLSGIEESSAVVKQLAEECDFSSVEGAIYFSTKLEALVSEAAGAKNKAPGMSQILRKDKKASAVYDLIFNLEYLEPRYSLIFQGAQIEQLSPGQRGALLLIFYLLVDRGRNPIILDQPEENLDNETIVNLLVPVLTQAKKKTTNIDGYP